MENTANNYNDMQEVEQRLAQLCDYMESIMQAQQEAKTRMTSALEDDNVSDAWQFQQHVKLLQRQYAAYHRKADVLARLIESESGPAVHYSLAGRQD